MQIKDDDRKKKQDDSSRGNEDVARGISKKDLQRKGKDVLRKEKARGYVLNILIRVRKYRERQV
jgi:hypothetical protein